MITIFRDSRLAYQITDSTDIEDGVQRVRLLDPAVSEPAIVPTWDLPGGQVNYPNSGVRAGRRMIGGDGTVYLVVASDQ